MGKINFLQQEIQSFNLNFSALKVQINNFNNLKDDGDKKIIPEKEKINSFTKEKEKIDLEIKTKDEERKSKLFSFNEVKLMVEEKLLSKNSSIKTWEDSQQKNIILLKSFDNKNKEFNLLLIK